LKGIFFAFAPIFSFWFRLREPPPPPPHHFSDGPPLTKLPWFVSELSEKDSKQIDVLNSGPILFTVEGQLGLLLSGPNLLLENYFCFYS
jgi:hypothetical protein